MSKGIRQLKIVKPTLPLAPEPLPRTKSNSSCQGGPRVTPKEAYDRKQRSKRLAKARQERNSQILLWIVTLSILAGAYLGYTDYRWPGAAIGLVAGWIVGSGIVVLAFILILSGHTKAQIWSALIALMAIVAAYLGYTVYGWLGVATGFVVGCLGGGVALGIVIRVTRAVTRWRNQKEQ